MDYVKKNPKVVAGVVIVIVIVAILVWYFTKSTKEGFSSEFIQSMDLVQLESTQRQLASQRQTSASRSRNLNSADGARAFDASKQMEVALESKIAGIKERLFTLAVSKVVRARQIEDLSIKNIARLEASGNSASAQIEQQLLPRLTERRVLAEDGYFNAASFIGASVEEAQRRYFYALNQIGIPYSVNWKCFKDGAQVGQVDVNWGPEEKNGVWACNQWRSNCENRCTVRNTPVTTRAPVTEYAREGRNEDREARYFQRE